MKRTRILLPVTVILASMIVSSVLACTTHTPGYFKTHHPEEWFIPEIPGPTAGALIVGGGPMPEATALELLWTPPRGDAWIILAQKVIAAQLAMAWSIHYGYDGPGDWPYEGNFKNYPTGEYPAGYPGGMIGMVADANALLDAKNEYRPREPGRADVLRLADIIDYWLNFYDEYGL